MFNANDSLMNGTKRVRMNSFFNNNTRIILSLKMAE